MASQTWEVFRQGKWLNESKALLKSSEYHTVGNWWPTQTSIPPGWVNEYQLRLEGKGRYGSFS